MRMTMIAGFVALILTAPILSQETPQAPTPTKEHQLLEKFGGEWVTEGEFTMVPGEPSIKSEGTEVTRSIGGFWSVTEFKGDFQGEPFTGVMTVGYDPESKKYVGTWVCSMCHMLSKYEGHMDDSGKVLTLNTEGPCPMTGKTIKMRDVIELKDKDTKVMTSYAQGDDGQWQQFMSLTAHRKK